MNKEAFTENFDHAYSQFAGIYGWLLDWIPIWNRWTGEALAYVRGPRVLEVSFGTGHLISRYAGQFQVYGVDLNTRMARQAKDRLEGASATANLQIADVVAIPYAPNSFDTVLNTMSFSGYPDGRQALIEMKRVLKPGGRLVMIDVNFPGDGNIPGMLMASVWKAAGDLLRDVSGLFERVEWQCQDIEVGGFGTVHLYLATK